MSEVELTIVTMQFDASDPDALQSVLAKYIVMTRMDPACRNIDLCASVTSPGRFVIVQKWDSPAAQQAHFDSDVMVDMADRLPGPAVSSAVDRPAREHQRPRPQVVEPNFLAPTGVRAPTTPRESASEAAEELQQGGVEAFGVFLLGPVAGAFEDRRPSEVREQLVASDRSESACP